MAGSRRLLGVSIQELAQDSPTRRQVYDATKDPDGFEEFVQATGDRIYRAALLLCGDHHLAEDLTQQTFTKVYAAWSTASTADSPVAYTRKVLMRTFLSHRRLRRSSEWPVRPCRTRAIDGPHPEDRLDLLGALRRLPPPDRAVLVLRYGRTSRWPAPPSCSGSARPRAGSAAPGPGPAPRPGARPHRPRLRADSEHDTEDPS